MVVVSTTFSLVGTRQPLAANVALQTSAVAASMLPLLLLLLLSMVELVYGNEELAASSDDGKPTTEACAFEENYEDAHAVLLRHLVVGIIEYMFYLIVR